jgi:hypothetical protein
MPLHGEFEQKPSAQKPVLHSLAALHVAPCTLNWTHCPPLQVLPAEHCAGELQLVAQADAFAQA